MKGGVTAPNFTVKPFASGSLKADGAQGVVFGAGLPVLFGPGRLLNFSLTKTLYTMAQKQTLEIAYFESLITSHPIEEAIAIFCSDE